MLLNLRIYTISEHSENVKTTKSSDKRSKQFILILYVLTNPESELEVQLKITH